MGFLTLSLQFARQIEAALDCLDVLVYFVNDLDSLEVEGARSSLGLLAGAGLTQSQATPSS